MNILTHLAGAEKIYFSLSFITKKIFRKDFARDNYRVLVSELKKTEETAQSSHSRASPPVECSLLTEVCRHLSQFVQARLELIDFYESLASVGVLPNSNYADLVSIIEEIIEKHQKGFHHPILDPLKSSFSLEVDVLHHALQAQCDMTEWKFLPSLLHLNESHSKLLTWGQLLPALSSKELSVSLSTKKSIFSSAPKKQAEAPFLYLWLNKLQASLVSKFTLYFFTILSAQTSQAEMKTLTARATTDYIAKITAFQRRSDALNISILFDAQTLDSYRGHGYHFPQDKMDQPAGVGAFPAIVSIPGERPVEHWPNIISIIMDKNHGHDLTYTDKIVYFFDNRVQSTYFLTRIDYRMTLIITFCTKKAEKDSYITTFMNDIACHLRNTKIFSVLKQGT
ncbi:KICSTOR complex protein C12orf66-like isoform X2 [Actinia tenebrosa]|nr:KICSTOR complex protein C12orf66-like isoform X2 [Actinia tenebrosa]